jgi:hemolysin III
MPDGGPRYAETDLSRTIVEPWNALSAALFLIVVALWARRLQGCSAQHRFLVGAVPVLAIGGIGGTVYHAFRMSAVFLVMDWLPIMLLCVAGGMYFWYLVFGRWWAPAVAMCTVFGLEFLNFRFWEDENFAINISYSLLALTVLLPMLLWLMGNRWFAARWVVLSLLAFAAALTFRVADGWGWLPMGTHFLWHVGGAFACHWVFQFIFLVEEKVYHEPRIPARAGIKSRL